MKPLEKEIADYVQTTLAHIASPSWTSAAELKKWWFSQRQKDIRASFVITGSTPEHQRLYNAFIARGNALATASHINGANK